MSLNQFRSVNGLSDFPVGRAPKFISLQFSRVLGKTSSQKHNGTIYFCGVLYRSRIQRD